MWNRLIILTALLTASILTGCGGAASSAMASATGGDLYRGAAAISRYGCGSCHTIKGISGANGLVGPPLTGIGSRLYVAGMLTNIPENIEHWIQDPTGINPHTVMPKLGVNH